MATEAREALQAKRAQVVDIEEQAFQYVHSTENRAQGEVMQKDMDLQRQAEETLTLQQAVSKLELQANDYSMNAQNDFKGS